MIRRQKFRVATAGLAHAIKTQSSLWIHLAVAPLVTILGVMLQIDFPSHAILLLAIGLVVTSETLNTSIEFLVAKLHPDQDPDIGLVLDIAAGAVLVASLIAVVVGLLILGPPLWTWLL